MEKIDFVVTWVDGNDPNWLKERIEFCDKEGKSDGSVVRFRDWDLMRYWFRAVERFAPWVNHIYFVTWGHYPQWLNLDHPKLKIIRHTDYMPSECLPVYNSNVIELFLRNIEELNEHFVLFNDDMFLTDDVKPADFFKNGLPCETVILGQTFGLSYDDVFNHTIFNNIAVLNKHFSKKQVIKKHWKKFFSFKYGAYNVRTALLLPFGHFSGFLDLHLPTAHLKSTFDEVWGKEEQTLRECAKNRFRSKTDVTHWLMKNWRYCKGEFVPRSVRWGKSFSIGKDETFVSAIKEQRYKVVCLNDDDPDLDFAYYQQLLKDAFKTILPEKSSFEK